MPRQIEAGLQEAVIRYLGLTLRDCVVFSIPNGGLRSFKTAKLMKRTGALAGVFDLPCSAGIQVGIDPHGPPLCRHSLA